MQRPTPSANLDYARVRRALAHDAARVIARARDLIRAGLGAATELQAEGMLAHLAARAGTPAAAERFFTVVSARGDELPRRELASILKHFAGRFAHAGAIEDALAATDRIRAISGSRRLADISLRWMGMWWVAQERLDLAEPLLTRVEDHLLRLRAWRRSAPPPGDSAAGSST